MSASPPKRPPGPPPPRAPPQQGIVNNPTSFVFHDQIMIDSFVGGGPADAVIRRPMGPPPTAPPPRVGAIKPPPMAPPPADLQQTAQRPGVESAKQIAAEMKSTMLEKSAEATAAPKPIVVVPQQAKAGAISMFEQPIEKPVQPPPTTPPPTEPMIAAPRGVPARGLPRGPPPRPPGQGPMADPSVPLMRAPRPGPPRQPPPGIPAGQALPPSSRPPEEKRPPAPARPPPISPDGGRAPPKEDPAEELRRRRQQPVTAPDTEPPLLRVKKPKEVPFVKRRERDMPEFESSDEDEEEPNYVKQPLPFGVLKGEVPPLKTGGKDDDEELPQKVAADAIPSSVSGAKDGASVGASAMSAETKRSDFQPSSSVMTKSLDPPSVAPSDTQVSAFVPSAPIAMDQFVDDSSIGKTLNSGRLSIRCIEGVDIRRKDDKDRVPRNDPFIKFRLGAAERHPWKSTQVKRKQNANPQFDNEVVYFDITDPKQFIFNEDVQLCIELWNKSTSKNDLVGSVTMSVLRFFKQPFVSYTERVPIYYPGATRTSMKVSNGQQSSYLCPI